MGRRTILPKFQVFKNVSTVGNPSSDITECTPVDRITYEVEIDPTVNAQLEVHYCNDPRISDSSLFKPISFNQPTPLDGSMNTQGMVHIQNLGFKHLRLVVLNNGGTGNIRAWVSGTVEGA